MLSGLLIWAAVLRRLDLPRVRAQAITSSSPPTADDLQQRLQQVTDQLQAIRNHQAINQISLFHWTEPRLWLLLGTLVGVFLLLLYVRHRTLGRNQQPSLETGQELPPLEVKVVAAVVKGKAVKPGSKKSRKKPKSVV